MKNATQAGERITLIAPTGGVVSGQGYVINGLFVIASHDADAGEEFTGRTGAFEFKVFELPKNTSQAFLQGQIAYWDDTAKEVKSTSASGLFKIGVATEAYLAADTEAEVRLDGISVVAVPAP